MDEQRGNRMVASFLVPATYFLALAGIIFLAHERSAERPRAHNHMDNVIRRNLQIRCTEVTWQWVASHRQAVEGEQRAYQADQDDDWRVIGLEKPVQVWHEHGGQGDDAKEDAA